MLLHDSLSDKSASVWLQCRVSTKMGCRTSFRHSFFHVTAFILLSALCSPSNAVAIGVGQTVPCSGIACNATTLALTTESATELRDGPNVPCTGSESACSRISKSTTDGPYDYVCSGQLDGNYAVPEEICPDYFIYCYEEVGYPRECSAMARDSREGERVTGGQETDPNEFPWQAYILGLFWNGEAVTCGGALISDEWVLTGAHCFSGTVNITITLGVHDTSISSSDSHRQTFTVLTRNVFYYFDWYYPDLEGDLALIKLPTKAVINDYVKPINLPYRDDPSFEGENVFLTGWGNFSSAPDSGLSPKLRKTITSVLGSQGGNQECQRKAGQSFSGDKIICGDGANSHRSCFGDDGGPMNYYREEESAWVVIGVASPGDKSSECATSVKPSLYNRVSYYVDWIHNKTSIPPRTRPTTTTTTTTETPSEGPYDYVCQGKPDGDYTIPDLVCPEYFVTCYQGFAYPRKCPTRDAGAKIQFKTLS